MPYFRKKPVVIKARRFDGDGTVLAVWCGGQFTYDALGHCILIDTLECQMRAGPGDWIIRGVKGEFYPCKDDIFRATYDEEVRTP